MRRRRRRREPMTVWDVEFGTLLQLQFGVDDDALRRTPGLEAELRKLWAQIGQAFLPRPSAPEGFGDTNEDCHSAAPGTRAWGFWRFDLGRDEPDIEEEQFQFLKRRGLLLGAWEEHAAQQYLASRQRHDTTGGAL